MRQGSKHIRTVQQPTCTNISCFENKNITAYNLRIAEAINNPDTILVVDYYSKPNYNLFFY